MENGKIGQPIDNQKIYETALLMRVNPAEIEEWDMYHIERLWLVKTAQALADQELARRTLKSK